MSSPSPSNKPYKSRLFNFVNRHYIKLNSQVNVKFREWGYVAKTGLQTLVFPFFWLWETTKKISKTFSPASSSVSSGLKNSSLQKTLTSGDDLIKSVNEAINLHPQLTSFPVKNFQGFASRLKDKQIICVLENNKFSDIIPLDKQGEVNNIINNVIDRLTNPQILPSTENYNFFSRFLAWFNIFGKSKMEVKISQDINNLHPSDLVLNNSEFSLDFSPQQSYPLILFIDNFFASLETISFSLNSGNIITLENENNNIEINSENLNEKQDNTFSILIFIQQAIDYFFKRKKNPNNLIDNKKDDNILSQLPSQSNNKPSLPEIDNKSSTNPIQIIISQSQETISEIIPLIQDTAEEIITQSLTQLNVAKNNLNNKLNNPEDPFQVKILIWAAINYFFNKKNKPNNLASNNNQQNFLPSFSSTEVILINEEVADPWLSWEDLYGDNTLPDFSPHNDNSLRIIEDKEIIEETDKKAIALTSELSELPMAKEKNNQTITRKTDSENATIKKDKREKKEKVILEAIEVKVIEIKYEKHFLQFILEKLDQLMLWLEEIIVKIVKKIKSLVQKLN
ncbi:hypothetical protein [Geminocystis sp. GBBB08]|uniref:hypothetical protein n=1 Tax=Geminocystis sp. GBBB08 TaxID=2604140 RepID=UPI0027E322E3|nr:hypothetical protein [Geminocystis sp. GBBB08]MBL1210341.1 hypothetical protein [Geminocystis sp. GBBB08]